MLPKPERFAQESSVTIAIGLLASDGIVLAADREEGDLYQKIDQGKIRARYQDAAPYNTMMVGGAGSGAYADAFSEEVLQWFSKTHPFDTESIETALRTLNKTFYKEHVIPLGTYPAQERPDYALLAVCKTSEGSGLWTSDHLVLNRKYPYAAIGSGALTARALLNELYAYVPVISAINLAVYVIGEVKRFVPGCGLDTDVLFASADSPPVKIVGDDVREIEDALRVFNKLLRRADFHHHIGSDLSQDPRTKPDKVARGKERILNQFEQINQTTITRLASRKSGQGQ